MIYYDSRYLCSMLKIRGSVLPQAMIWALPSAISAYALGWAAQQGYIPVESLQVLAQNDIYSGFTYVLGFSLVFRTSQAYARYWQAATSIHEMASEWSDSCASIIAFTSVSSAPAHEVERFQHTIVRLFSLLHGMAMAEVARVEDDLPLLDVKGLSRRSLELLTSSQAQGRKVHIVLSWIKCYITQQAASGLLNVPAPLLTRVFQELGSGLVKFHTAQQVVIWPFPFPYTQLNVILMQIYALITPLVISTWNTWPFVHGAWTFISVTFLVGLNFIASELENPFGDDPNDLPVMELQKDINTFLAMQLDPLVRQPPELLQGHVVKHKELIERGCWFNQSLNKRLLKHDTPGARLRAALTPGVRGDKLRAQMAWCGEAASESELDRLKNWLKCKTGSASVMEEQPPAAPTMSALSVASSELMRDEAESEQDSCEMPAAGHWRSGDVFGERKSYAQERGAFKGRGFGSCVRAVGSGGSSGDHQAFRTFLEELSESLAQRHAAFLEALRTEQSLHLKRQLKALEAMCPFSL